MPTVQKVSRTVSRPGCVCRIQDDTEEPAKGEESGEQLGVCVSTDVLGGWVAEKSEVYV